MRNGKYDLVIAPDEYTGKRYRGKYCYLHHLVYWQNTGIVPSENEIIHHIDGNTRNNDFSNLQLMDKHEHILHHDSLRKKAVVLLRCPVCCKEFVKDKNKTHLQKHGIATFCSLECCYKANTLRSKRDKTFLKNVSQNVIKEFFVCHSSVTVIAVDL